jgi:hypothetical protein
MARLFGLRSQPFRCIRSSLILKVVRLVSNRAGSAESGAVCGFDLILRQPLSRAAPFVR